MVRARIAAALALGVIASGCQFPADVEGTLDRVRGGTLRVGVVKAEPWVRTGEGEPRGVEPELLRRFALRLGAKVRWVEGSESSLMDALHSNRLDVVIAGLTRRSGWSRRVTLTQPYLEARLASEREEHARCMAVVPGENAFLLELERFLLGSEREANRLLESEGTT